MVAAPIAIAGSEPKPAAFKRFFDGIDIRIDNRRRISPMRRCRSSVCIDIKSSSPPSGMFRPRLNVRRISIQSRLKKSARASNEPKWTVASNAADGGSQPRTHDAMIMYPLLLMGSSSVKPCMKDSVAIWTSVMGISKVSPSTHCLIRSRRTTNRRRKPISAW